MKIKKKSIIISSTILAMLFFIIPFIFKVYFSIVFSSHDLKKVVIEFFKINFNRAVKLEDIYIDYMGDVIISNISLSLTSDFNDNLNILEAKRMIIKTKFFQLLKRRMIINGFYCDNNNIIFIKKYFNNYKDIFDKTRFLQGQKIVPGNIDFNSLRLRFNNSSIFFIESYKERKVKISLSDVDIDVKVSPEHLGYSIKGNIEPNKSKQNDKGDFSFKGIYRFKGDKENYFSIENFDLSYFNDLYKKYNITDKALFGGLSLKIKSLTANNNTRFWGSIEGNNLNLVSVDKNKYNMLTNENMKFIFDLNFNHDFSTFNVTKLNISNDSVRIKTTGSYRNDKKDEIIKLSLMTNEIELKELSGNFTPFNGARYSGKINSTINIEYDLKNKKNIKSTCAIQVKNFELKKLENGKVQSIIANGEATLDYSNNKLLTQANFKSNKSDIKLRIDSDIKSIEPLHSTTTVTIDSHTLELPLLYDLFTRGIDSIYQEAYIDQKKGYEQIFFLNLPTGKMLNANDVSLVIKANHLLIRNNAKLNDFIFDSYLKSGIVQLKEFKINGYDGNYALTINGNFNRDMPFVGIAGHIKEFDLEKFFKDAGYSGEVKGKLQTDFEFELVASRISHLLENAKGKCNVLVEKSVLKQTNFQKQFNAFLKSNKYVAIEEHMESGRFTISFSQAGQHFFIMNFSMVNPVVNFGAYGNYDYPNGLKVPVYLNVKNLENKQLTIPLMVQGQLQNPCISILNKKDSSNLCFDLK